MILNNYQMSLNPGYFEGVSSSYMSGFNVGVNKNIEDNLEKVEAAKKFLEFSTSIDIQKELFMAGESIPAVNSIFDDEEVRNIRGAETCDMFKNVQIMKKPNINISEIPDYGNKFYLHSKNYLYNGVSINDTINRLENISKIYYISLDSSDSSIGLISVTIISVISLIMLFSIVFLFRDNFIPFFKFLPSGMYIIVIIGAIMTICASLTNVGQISVSKCQAKIELLTTGFTLYTIPILAQLIINFPDYNNISNWVKKHKYLFLLFFLLIDNILFSFSLLKPYFKVQIIIPKGDSDRKNFKECKMNSGFPVIIFLIAVIIKFMILLISLILIFIEWNIKSTFYEIRFIVNTVYSTLLLIAMLIIVDNININDYKLFFVLQIVIISFISISNYLFIYGFKLILAIMNKKNVIMSFIKKINDNFINNEINSTQYTTYNSNCYSKNITETQDNYDNSIKHNYIDGTNCNTNCTNNTNSNDSMACSKISNSKSTFINKIINYHYLVDSNNNFEANVQSNLSETNQSG